MRNCRDRRFLDLNWRPTNMIDTKIHLILAINLVSYIYFNLTNLYLVFWLYTAIIYLVIASLYKKLQNWSSNEYCNTVIRCFPKTKRIKKQKFCDINENIYELLCNVNSLIMAVNHGNFLDLFLLIDAENIMVGVCEVLQKIRTEKILIFRHNWHLLNVSWMLGESDTPGTYWMQRDYWETANQRAN